MSPKEERDIAAVESKLKALAEGHNLEAIGLDLKSNMPERESLLRALIDHAKESSTLMMWNEYD